MRYLTFCTFEIVHGYYTDRRCIDFQIEPTPGTQKLLGDHRCVLKRFPNGVRILIAVNNENTPFIPLPPKPVLAFHLLLSNHDFELFTDLTEFRQLVAPLYTNKLPSVSGELVPVSQESWSSEQFVVLRPAPKETFVLRGRPLSCLKPEKVFLVEDLGEKSACRGYDEGARVITINSSKAKPGTLFTVTYPIMPRLERGVFADVEIRYGSPTANLSENAASFRITFQPKKARWKYYLVTEKSNGQTDLPSIEDKDKVIFFNAEDQMDLSQTPDPGDGVAVKLAKQYPNKRCLRFISSNLIPCQQAARKNIQLRLNGNKVINSLPNPSLQNYCIDLRNAAHEYTLYQVIQYFT